MKRILLGNITILTDDPATRELFPQPPLVAYRRDILVHMTDRNQPDPLIGFYVCNHVTPPCRSPNAPSSSRRPSPVKHPVWSVYCISCRRSPILYIGNRSLKERIGEYLQNIEKNFPGIPLAEHFNANGHSLHDAEIRGVKLCGGNKQCKRQEMRLIFQLDGTSQPRGLNYDFVILFHLNFSLPCTILQMLVSWLMLNEQMNIHWWRADPKRLEI